METPSKSPTQSQAHLPNLPAYIAKRGKGISGRVQAANLQRLLFEALLALRRDHTDKETGKLVIDAKTAVAFNRLALAWDKVSDRLRILRGRGLPASERRKPRRDTWSEPLNPL